MQHSLESCQALDASDPLAFARNRFEIAAGIIYLDGNSLGALPRSTPGRLMEVMREEWGKGLIGSWNSAGWINLPLTVGAEIAGLIGAQPSEVLSADSTSVNLFKLAAGAFKAQAPRKVILSEHGNFPTDLYMLQGLGEFLGAEVELRVVASADLASALNQEVALLVLTHAHYKSGVLHDMAALTRRAHDVGALALWDLSHSAGAMPVELNLCKADLAIGCGYKYLNGGPGAPGFLYVAENLQNRIFTPLSGWMGHAAPFAFDDTYSPAIGIRRFLCGTPPILGLAALQNGLKQFEGVHLSDIRRKSCAVGDLFLELLESRCGDFGFEIACPRDAHARGSQISLRHSHGYSIIQAMIDRGVIGDFRAPDILRFGFAPLYIRYADIWNAAEILRQVMESGAWRDSKYQQRSAVT